MVSHPSGSHVYATSFMDHLVYVYAVDQTTGALTHQQTVLTNTGPERLAIDPLGRFLFIAHRPSADIRIFTVNPDGDAYLDSLERVYGFNPNVPSSGDILDLTYDFTFEGQYNVDAYAYNAAGEEIGTAVVIFWVLPPRGGCFDVPGTDQASSVATAIRSTI